MSSASPQAVALVSGGMDSAVAAALVKAEGLELIALSFDYGQRHRRELEAARQVATWLNARDHRVVRVELEKIGGSALTADLEVPKDREFGGVPLTYVPARNLIFLALGLGLAEAVGAEAIVIGANAIDYSGYPDCRPEFLAAFERAAAVGTRAGALGRPVRVHAPLVAMTKARIVTEGLRLGLDFGLTWSCYDPAPAGAPCGRCDACRLRAKGFAEAGTADPLLEIGRP